MSSSSVQLWPLIHPPVAMKSLSYFADNIALSKPFVWRCYYYLAIKLLFLLSKGTANATIHTAYECKTLLLPLCLSLPNSSLPLFFSGELWLLLRRPSILPLFQVTLSFPTPACPYELTGELVIGWGICHQLKPYSHIYVMWFRKDHTLSKNVVCVFQYSRFCCFKTHRTSSSPGCIGKCILCHYLPILMQFMRVQRNRIKMPVREHALAGTNHFIVIIWIFKLLEMPIFH